MNTKQTEEQALRTPYPILPAQQRDPYIRKAWVVLAFLIHSQHLPVPDAGKHDPTESLAHAVAIIREALYYCEYGKTTE